MFRRSLSRVCSLGDRFREASGIWGFRFGDDAVTQTLNFHKPADSKSEPIFHVMDIDGKVVNEAHDPHIPKETAVRIISSMVTMNMAEQTLLDAQRQGSIPFFLASFGEEGSSVGSMAAIEPEDHVFMQYRESAGLLYRGFSVERMIAQCQGNVEDNSKGRQMPVHYGSKELNHHTISSPLATQIPQAAGVGYAFKLDKADKIVVCFFGDGSASEGDFHAGLNYASTLGSQSLFFCRNNGYAISTPTGDQYHGDGIHPRGVAYGIPSLRVDGTDVLAVYRATALARELIIKEKTPVLIEAVSYRLGHHTTSDDSSLYRSKDEIARMGASFNPILRFEKYLADRGWWSAEDSDRLRKEAQKMVKSEIKRQSALPPVSHEELFTDTFDEMTANLKQQRDETLAHLAANQSFYQAK